MLIRKSFDRTLMLRLMTNMRILIKLAIPAVVIAVACLLIVGYAIVSLNSLAETSDSVIRGEAKRVELSLQAEAQFNSAAISEKNAILATGPASLREAIDRYNTAVDEVGRSLDQLAAITEAADQLASVDAFRNAVAQRRAVSAKVFALALVQKDGEAIALSSGAGAQARKLAVRSVDRLIALNRERLDSARQGEQALATRTRIVLVTISLAGLCVAFALLGWIAAFQIGQPLSAMARQMQRLAAGDLSICVAGAEREDEVGALARSLEVFKHNAITGRRLEAEQREEQSRKEHRQRAIEGHISVFDKSASAAIATLAAAATELSATSKSMSDTAAETSRQAGNAATGSQEASNNVQTVAAATEQLAASVSEIARQVAACSGVAADAVREAEATNTKMRGLTEAADRIGTVIALIKNIASQTNLLALNATIEAARADEHGKGFAVVASEVKALANQTATATGEISTHIASIQGATHGAVEAIRGIAATIGKIDQITVMIASAVEQQGAATQEIAHNVQLSAQGTQVISMSISGVNHAVAETGEAAGNVLEAANELGMQGEHLRRDIGEFLANIRAA
jgi:methyl-accepting chemotaxis protein